MNKYIPQMKQALSEMKLSAHALKQEYNISQVQNSTQLANLEKQIIVLQVYLDDAHDRYEWKGKLWLKAKNELSIFGLIFLAIGLVATFAHLVY